jgi:uncharacterized protein YjbJ (UPF0337 family)
MGMNEDTIKGKWREIKGEVQKTWGKLTDDELEATKGDAKSIGGLIQQRYADQKDSYKEKLNGIMRKYTDKKDAAVEDVKDKLRN